MFVNYHDESLMKKIMSDTTISIVIITTPTSTHYKIIKLALEANKHVFVEKPVTNGYEL